MSVNFYLENWGVSHHEEPVHMLSSDFSVISHLLKFRESGFLIKESISLGEIRQRCYPDLKRNIIKVLNSPSIQSVQGSPDSPDQPFDFDIPRNRLDFQLKSLLDLISTAQKENIYIYFG